MNLAQIVPNLKKVGNEWHGPCPFCGKGKDRFCVWEDEGRDDTGRYWCRQCDEKGDAIDYLKQIEGLSYAECLVRLDVPEDEYTKDFTPMIGQSVSVNGQEESAYDYTDEKGDVLFQVVRGAGKKFRQRIPTEDGWSYKVKGVRRVLYHLPEVNKAIQEGRFVFLVEGEKDCHTLESMNLTATTSSQGSSSWLDEYADLLSGVKEMILIPDRDKPGLKYMAAVADSLKKREILYRVVHLDFPLADREGKDISDWIKDRNISLSQGRSEIIAMTKGATDKVYLEDKPYPKPYTMEELLAQQFAPVEWVVSGVVPFGVTLLIAKPKVGKTFFALSIAHAIATGGKALGSIDVKKGRVLYLVLEDSKRGLQKRMENLIKMGGITEGRMMFSNEWNKLDEEGLNHLGLFLKDNPDTKLVVIDTLKRVRPTTDYRKGLYDQDYEAVFPLISMGDTYNTSFLVIHHANKSQEIEDPADLASGSTGLTAAVENIMVMRNTATHPGVDLWMKGRDAEQIEIALTRDLDTLGWKYEGESMEFGMSQQRKKIIDVVEESGEAIGPKEIAELTDISYSSTQNIVAKMVRDNILMKSGYGKYVLNPSYVYDSKALLKISKPGDTGDTGDTPGKNKSHHPDSGGDSSPDDDTFPF